MSRKRNAEDLKAKLAAMSTGGRAPGSEQASRALAAPGPSPQPREQATGTIEAPPKNPEPQVSEPEASADDPSAPPVGGRGVEVKTAAPDGAASDNKPEDVGEPSAPTPTRSKKSQAAKKEVDPLDEKPQEKVSVLLYADDVAAIDRVEATLKEHGLIGRAAPAAWLLRVAAAHFSESTSRAGLEKTIKSIKAKDGRGKWRG